MRTSLRPSFWILLGGTLLFDVLLLIPSPAQVMIRPSEKWLCPVPVADVGHRVRCLTEAEARWLAVSPGVVLPLGPDGERLVGPPQRMSGEQQLALGLRLDPNQASANTNVSSRLTRRCRTSQRAGESSSSHRTSLGCGTIPEPAPCNARRCSR